MPLPSSHNITIQGHRGARGLFPENTITGFIETIKLGIYTLEMDVIISKDGQVVVSHEPWMNDKFCTRPNGDPVEKDSKEKYNLYKMTYAEIAKYDCGLRKNPNFPAQKSFPEHKPLLSDVLASTEDHTRTNGLPSVTYNIEIKSDPQDDNLFQPAPANFVDLVKTHIEKYKIEDRILLQSFDIRILKEIKKQGLKNKIGLLVENKKGLKANLGRLGFKPFMYNPHFSLVTSGLVKDLHALQIKIYSWTVNEIADMKNLIRMNVDGIITDYPDKAIELIKTLEIKN